MRQRGWWWWWWCSEGGLPKSNCRGFPMSNVQCGHQPAQVTPTSDIPISWIFPCHARPDTQTAATARYLFIADIPLSCTSGCNRYRTWAECCTAGVGLVDIGLKWSHWISDPGLAAALSSLVCVCSSPIKAFHRFSLAYLLTVLQNNEVVEWE